MIELKRAPVASTPMFFDRAQALFLDHLRHREDLGDRLNRDLGLDVAGGKHLTVHRDQRNPEQVRIDLGQGRNVVGVLAFLECPVLCVCGINRLLDFGGRLRV